MLGVRQTEVSDGRRRRPSIPFFNCGHCDTRKAAQTLFIFRDGRVAWSYTISERDNYFVDATRLSNGNVLFARKHGVTEVAPDKRVVWALREWTDPDLGPALSIQLLDEPGVPENGDLQLDRARVRAPPSVPASPVHGDRGPVGKRRPLLAEAFVRELVACHLEEGKPGRRPCSGC